MKMLYFCSSAVGPHWGASVPQISFGYPQFLSGGCTPGLIVCVYRYYFKEFSVGDRNVSSLLRLTS